MGVVKVEVFDVDVTATASQTHTLTNNVGSLNSAFVRRTTSIDKQSGPTGSTANANPNISACGAYLSSTTQISFRQNTTTSQKVVGEVWRYTGAASGADEFIVRGRYAITMTGATASQAVSGIVDRDKCIPFWTGTDNSNTSVDDYDASTVSVYIDASDNIQLERGSSTGTLVVYVTVVEFTGSNWSVGHGVSSSHDTATETVTLNTSSTGVGGSTFSVGSWTNAMIVEASLEGDTSETGLSDNLGCWVIGGSSSTADFILQQDGNARNDGASYCHVLSHPALAMTRGSNTNYGEGNGTYTNQAYTATGATLDEQGLEWFSDTSGVGTAHARGRLSAKIQTTTNIQAWVHRSGNNVRIDWGVADLSGIDNTVYLIIDDVDTDNIISNAQTNVVITASGGGFEALQGTGTVELTQNADGSGTAVTQSIDSWSDTSIQFDTTAGALADSNCYVYVTTDGGDSAAIAVTVGVPPETYQEAVEGMTLSPSHYWRMQNSYADEIGTATMNNSSGGTPSFETKILCKGDTHSFLLNATGDYVSPADQTDMNTSSTAQRRYIGGWLQVDRVSQALAVLYEEGAQINNFAMLNGFGNALMFQFADDGGDYVQVYADLPLTPNRPYLVLAEFNGPNYKSGQCKLHIDGVIQSRSNGNPWEVTAFPSHSGNITWGHEGTEVLQIGDSRGTDQTDIAFTSPVACNYSHWFNWTDVSLDDTTDIRETLFAKGALADTIIGADTEAAMQIAIDAEADTVFPDWPCGLDIGNCTAGNFELTFDNITFDDRCSMPIRYLGGSTLTVVLTNGSDLDESKCEAPYGGTIVVQRPATLTINGLINGSEVRLYDGPKTAGNFGTELDGIESLTGTSFQYSHSGAVNPIIIQMIADGYEEIILEYELGATDQILAVTPKIEFNT